MDRLVGMARRRATSNESAEADPACTRERIIDAALHMFAQRGFHQAVIDDIAASAGLSKGAVYWHFKSKSDLFVAVVRREVRRLTERLGVGATDAGRSVVERIKLLVGTTLSYYAEHAEFCSLMRVYSQPAGEELGSKIERLAVEEYRKGREMIEALVKEGVDRGELEPDATAVAAPVLVAILDGLMCQWLIDPSAVPMKKISRDVARAFLNGIARRPGSRSSSR